MSDYNDGILPEPCLRMDTHFGDEYESVEFGDGTGYIKAAPILAKVGALHGEIDRLRDESAELREELDCCLKLAPKCDGCEAMLDCDECLRADSSQKERKRLDYENAELRELARDMWTCILTADKSVNAWDECPRCSLWNGSNNHRCNFADRMRELGVEV